MHLVSQEIFKRGKIKTLTLAMEEENEIEFIAQNLKIQAPEIAEYLSGFILSFLHKVFRLTG